MNTKILVSCLAGIAAVASLSGCSSQSIASSPERNPLTHSPTRKVIYTLSEVPEGTYFTAEQLIEKDVKRPLTPKDAASDMQEIVGRQAKRAVGKGVIVTERDLVPREAQSDAAPDQHIASQSQ